MAADQLDLFDPDEFRPWRDEWKGMPEFVQEDLTAWKSLIVNFASQEDLAIFAKLVGQRLFYTTRSIWYPEAEIGRYANKRYADE